MAGGWAAGSVSLLADAVDFLGDAANYGISLFVLRRREPNLLRPFKVPLYPLLPLLFCATCAWMLWSSLSYVFSQSLGGLNAAWIGVAVLAAGLLLLAFLHQDEALREPSHANHDEESR